MKENCISFEYMFRDGGNYKTFGNIVFSNKFNKSIQDLTKEIKTVLIDGEYFYPNDAGIPRFDQITIDPDSDPSWYEFVGVEESNELPTDKRDISEIILNLKNP